MKSLWIFEEKKKINNFIWQITQQKKEKNGWTSDMKFIIVQKDLLLHEYCLRQRINSKVLHKKSQKHKQQNAFTKWMMEEKKKVKYE